MKNLSEIFYGSQQLNKATVLQIAHLSIGKEGMVILTPTQAWVSKSNDAEVLYDNSLLLSTRIYFENKYFYEGQLLVSGWQLLLHFI